MTAALEILDYGLAGAGVVLLVVFWRAQGSQVWSFPLPPEVRAVRIEALLGPVLVFLVTHQLALMALARAPEPSMEANFLANVLALTVAGSSCLLIARVTFVGGLRGFFCGALPWQRCLAWGAGGLLAALPACGLATWVSVCVIRWIQPGFQPPVHEVLELLERPDLPAWFVPLLWASAVGLAPLAEEAFFRGLCVRSLVPVLRSPGRAAAAVAVVFGAVHSQPHAVAPLAILGFVLGYVYLRTRAVLAPLTLHVLFNLKTMIYSVLLSS